MHPTLRSLEHVHKPMIRFLGKRQWSADAPHAHPDAPKDVVDRFTQLFSGRPSSASHTNASAGAGASAGQKKPRSSEGVLEFWELPDRLFRPRARRFEDWEIDVVQTGGASLH